MIFQACVLCRCVLKDERHILVPQSVSTHIQNFSHPVSPTGVFSSSGRVRLAFKNVAGKIDAHFLPPERWFLLLLFIFNRFRRTQVSPALCSITPLKSSQNYSFEMIVTFIKQADIHTIVSILNQADANEHKNDLNDLFLHMRSD